jgi:hypothetical protein
MPFVYTDEHGWFSMYSLCQQCSNFEWRTDYSRQYDNLPLRSDALQHALCVDFVAAMCIEAERSLRVAPGSITCPGYKRGYWE